MKPTPRHAERRAPKLTRAGDSTDRPHASRCDASIPYASRCDALDCNALRRTLLRRLALKASLVCIASSLAIALSSDSFVNSARGQATGGGRNPSLVSANRAGERTGNDESDLGETQPKSAISGDGRIVVFDSLATDLVANNNRPQQIYAHDLTTKETTLVSINRTSTNGGDGVCFTKAISEDGRYVAFTSTSTDLVATDTNGQADVFVRDLIARTTRLVTFNQAGTDSAARGATQAPGLLSDVRAISRDGRFVLFTSSAVDLVANDTNDATDLFVRDMTLNVTRAASVNMAGALSGNRSSLTSGGFYDFEPRMSADGRFVIFKSYANDLVPNDTICNGACNGANGLSDIFARDLVQNTTTLISVNRTGASGGNSVSSEPSISQDARYVAFRSFATDLVANDTTAQSDIYVRDTQARTTTLVSVNRSGTNGGAANGGGVNSVLPLISPDGRLVAFSSAATDIAPNKTSSFNLDLFVRDLTNGTTALVSVRPDGREHVVGGTTNGEPSSVSGVSDFSADGRFVVFSSTSDQLVAGDYNNSSDVFVRDLTNAVTHAVNLAPNSATLGNYSSDSADISADGRAVAFRSFASDLAASDQNFAADVFAYTLPAPAALAFESASYSFDENDAQGFVRLRVARTGDQSEAATIDYASDDVPELFNCNPQVDATHAGVATSRCDYSTTVGMLRFAAGETFKEILVPVTNDAHVEGDETFNVSLRNPSSGNSLGATQKATVTIRDDDAATNNQTNPLQDARFFVRQHYLDFFGRTPAESEVNGWVQAIQPDCPVEYRGECYDRIWVSGRGFFFSTEFQQKGYFIYRLYKLLGKDRVPTYREFLPDMVALQTTSEADKTAFIQRFTARDAYRAIYDTRSNREFVGRLVAQTGLTSLDSEHIISDLDGGAKTRTQVLRETIESSEMNARFFNEAWVVMQYFGYLRRDGAASEYAAWLAVINRNPNDYRTMTNGFVNSIEYRNRFGKP